MREGQKHNYRDYYENIHPAIMKIVWSMEIWPKGLALEDTPNKEWTCSSSF